MIVMQNEAATPMDEIQQRLFAVVGGEDPQEVLPLVEAQIAVANREIEQVPQRAQQLGAEAQSQLQEPLRVLVEQLGHYRDWLLESQQALQNEDPSQIVNAYEEAQAIIPALAQALESYSQVFASLGKFSLPWTNTLSRLAESIQNGHSPDQSWDEGLSSFQKSFHGKIQELRQVPLPGRSLVASAYQQALDCLLNLQSVDSLDAAAIDPELKRFEAATRQGQQWEVTLQEAAQGPASMPGTNIIIHLVKKALNEDGIDQATALHLLEDYREILDNFWEGFEQGLSRPVDSALIQDEVPRTLEYADAHDAAVEALGEALRQGDRGAAEQAMEELIQTSSQLDESREVFEAAAQHQAHVLCPSCGRANPPENRRCEACGNQLPTQEGQLSSTFSIVTGPSLEDNQEMPMTENVAKLFQACDDVAVGQISPDEFRAILAEATAGLQEYANELGEIAEETVDVSFMPEEMQLVWKEQHLPYVEEVGASFNEGLKSCEEGLHQMAAYLEDSEQDHLVEGVRLVWEGLGIIHRAQLSMTATLKMLDDILEEAREQGMLAE